MTAKPMTAERMTQPRCDERESSLDLQEKKGREGKRREEKGREGKRGEDIGSKYFSTKGNIGSKYLLTKGRI